MSPPFPLSDHFDGNYFHMPGAPRTARFLDLMKWRLGKASTPRGAWPQWVEISQHAPPVGPAGDSRDMVATWINHATFLLQTATANILFDPVFSRCCGPFGKIGPARVHVPGVALDALPRIDIVCLSHDHYDHCDIPSLRRLAHRDPQHPPISITPLGNGALLRRAGFVRERIVELDWWQPHTLAAGVRVALTPAQHWSKRLTSGRNRRLWGGFFITLPSGQSAYFAGDTGYHETLFGTMAARLGAPDVAMLPIGAYEPRWFMRPQHCNPAEAVCIHRDLGARQSVAMHWGTFHLTDEARDEPPRALARALREAGLASEAFKILQPGESLTIAS